MSFLDDLLAGGPHHTVSFKPDGASVRPKDDSDEALKAFQQVVDQIEANEGHGYTVFRTHESSDRPGSRVDLVLIRFQDGGVTHSEEGRVAFAEGKDIHDCLYTYPPFRDAWKAGLAGRRGVIARALGRCTISGGPPMADTMDQWEAFLNPDVVRTKLITAGLFLVGHEMLLDSIKRHPLEFFSHRWTIEGPEPSAEYAAEVLARDPKGKNDPLRGSIAWLRMMDAITAADEESIRVLTDARNEIAHEMVAMVSGSNEPDFIGCFATLMTLVQKIEKWWIVNVELPTNPDFDGQEINEDGIISGPSWVMQLLSQVALGVGDDAWEFHREFAKRRAGKAG